MFRTEFSPTLKILSILGVHPISRDEVRVLMCFVLSRQYWRLVAVCTILPTNIWRHVRSVGHHREKQCRNFSKESRRQRVMSRGSGIHHSMRGLCKAGVVLPHFEGQLLSSGGYPQCPATIAGAGRSPREATVKVLLPTSVRFPQPDRDSISSRARHRIDCT